LVGLFAVQDLRKSSTKSATAPPKTKKSMIMKTMLGLLFLAESAGVVPDGAPGGGPPIGLGPPIGAAPGGGNGPPPGGGKAGPPAGPPGGGRVGPPLGASKEGLGPRPGAGEAGKVPGRAGFAGL
jgi:hypothetical protein